jgi:protein-disulfide isomerase
VDAAHRAPFVLLVMVLLAVALVATLWLSTAAAADSYHLQSAQEQARNLTERSENLGREVASLETAPELARRARELGMVPAGDPARLVVRPDGSVVLIGQPRRATAPAPPPVSPAPAQPVPAGNT